MAEFQPPIAFYYLKLIPKEKWTKLFYLIILIVIAIALYFTWPFIFPNGFKAV